MGSDKAQLTFDGRRLLDIATDLLHDAGCGAVFISGRDGLPNAIPDSKNRRGPAHAILDCLNALEDRFEGVLFLPVDMPLLRAADLSSLLNAEPGTGCAWAGHPLPVFIPRGLPVPGREHIHSVKSLLAALPIRWLPLESTQSGRFANLNTQADVTAARNLR
jgi:molybdopterin-guanine dinucleotide biosynthesis protein A